MTIPAHDDCYRAVSEKDSRFDGWFFTGVKTTGIYCRPSCPARTPKAANVDFFPSAAAAQAAGFRACKRCRPDAVPGSPEWDQRADVAARAMRLIADGVVDREGVGGLSTRLGYSERHVHRQLVDVAGAGPLAIARANRARAARILLESTRMPIGDVALAAGFASVRQFNETIRDVFAASPRDLRRAAGPEAANAGAITLRLPYREPIALAGLFEFLGRRAVPKVEVALERGFARTLDLEGGPGSVVLTAAGPKQLTATFKLKDLRDLGAAVARVRTLCDLDSDPRGADAALSTDPAMRRLVRARPGIRVPGCVSAEELAVRAVLGQQVSVAAATTTAGRLAERHGEMIDAAEIGQPGLRRLFPRMQTLATVDPAELPMPRSRARTVVALAQALASGELRLDAGVERAEAREQLVALPGIGPWTAEYIAMRALRDPDAFLPTDLGVRRGLEALGEDGSPVATEARAESWRPYRAYALQHLWAAASDKGDTR